MSRDYSMELSDGVTVIRLLRKLNLAEILEVMDAVTREGVSNRRLWDLTEKLDFSLEEIQTIAARGKRNWPDAARVAWVAADQLAFGLLRMLEFYREAQDYEIKVFRDEAEALAWLKEWPGPKP